MPKSGEFYTFDEVIGQLSIDEQKLKRLVSEGEIRAFREGDEMKFKKSDIDSLDIGATEEGETREIDLSSGGVEASETLTDDLIFDEGDELDLSSDDAGMATAEISSQDTFVDEGGEPVGMSTEPLDFTDEGFDEEIEEELEEEATISVGGPATRPARPRVERYQPAAAGGDLLWGIVLSLSLLLLLFGGFVTFSASSHEGANKLSGFFVKVFDGDSYEYIKDTLGDEEK